LFAFSADEEFDGRAWLATTEYYHEGTGLSRANGEKGRLIELDGNPESARPWWI
jgi:hypothetical protein